MCIYFSQCVCNTNKLLVLLLLIQYIWFHNILFSIRLPIMGLNLQEETNNLSLTVKGDTSWAFSFLLGRLLKFPLFWSHSYTKCRSKLSVTLTLRISLPLPRCSLSFKCKTSKVIYLFCLEHSWFIDILLCLVMTFLMASFSFK